MCASPDNPNFPRPQELGVPLFRVSFGKMPFAGGHGHRDAVRDPEKWAAMERAHPYGLWAMPTGEASGFDIVDRDMKKLPDGTAIWGGDSLGDAGLGYFLESTPTVITPRGTHQWFRHPAERYVKSGPLVVAGKPVLGVDIKGSNACVILPPGPGRFWDPILGPGTPLADLPSWAIMERAQPAAAPDVPAPRGDYTAYGEAAIDRIVDEICSAGLGNQEAALNSGAFAIGQLVAGEEIAASYALRLFDWLAPRVQSLDARRPWRAGEIEKKLERSYLAGQRRPRSARS
jgi:hypothetical protein